MGVCILDAYFDICALVFSYDDIFCRNKVLLEFPFTLCLFQIWYDLNKA